MKEYTHAMLVQEAGHDWLEYVTDDDLAFVRELGETFGPDCTLREAQLRLTERAFAQECELYQVYNEIADELAEKVATAEGLEPEGKEWAKRITELTLTRYHELTDARKAV